MRAAVLGGTGFVGRHICAGLAAAGASVFAVSRTGPVPADLTSAAGPRRLAALIAAERVDVVVNAAGSVWQCTAADMARGNVELVDRLLETVLGQAHRPRLIQLGTVHEYGPGHAGASTAEEHPPAPVNDYGRTKLLGTRAVLRAARTHGLDAVVLRVANVCGPGTPPGSLLRAVADHLARAAKDQANGVAPEPLRFGALRAWRDFVDARDVADAVLAAARADRTRGQVINIGRGQAVQMRWLVDRMVALSGLEVPVVEAPETPPGDTPPGGGAQWQQLRVSTAWQVLGWRPRRGLDESLRDLLAASPHIRGREARR